MKPEKEILKLKGLVRSVEVDSRGALTKVIVTLDSGETFEGVYETQKMGNEYYAVRIAMSKAVDALESQDQNQKKESSWIEQAKQERATLEKSIAAVRFSLGSRTHGRLDSISKYDLEEQLTHMSNYSWVLHRRICRGIPLEETTTTI